MATVGGSGDTSFNWASVFSLPPTGVLSRSVTLLCQRRLFTFYSMWQLVSQHQLLQTACGMQAEDLRVEQIYSVQICRESVAINVGPPDSEGSGLKYKVKVLLRSQSKLIPPLLAYSRLAYGDTEWRSMSITDGAAQESEALELTLICAINQLAVTAALTWVAANASQRGDLKSVCWNNIKMTQALQQSLRISVTCLILTPDRMER